MVSTCSTYERRRSHQKSLPVTDKRQISIMKDYKRAGWKCAEENRRTAAGVPKHPSARKHQEDRTTLRDTAEVEGVGPANE